MSVVGIKNLSDNLYNKTIKYNFIINSRINVGLGWMGSRPLLVINDIFSSCILYFLVL